MKSPIPYTLKVSRRARSARLRMMPHEGLVVVIPTGFDRREVPALVERHREWVERTAARLDRHRRPEEPLLDSGIPARLRFGLTGEEWELSCDGSRRRPLEDLCSAPYGLVLPADPSDSEAAMAVLHLWLKKRARQVLFPMLGEAARQMGFSFAASSVRLQQSRWGSCSSKGRISLNIKLLFLPPELVRYIIVHELCHTVHMNHSKAFWSLVARHEPGYARLDREMRHAWRFVPAWVAAGPGA